MEKSNQHGAWLVSTFKSTIYNLLELLLIVIWTSSLEEVLICNQIIDLNKLCICSILKDYVLSKLRSLKIVNKQKCSLKIAYKLMYIKYNKPRIYSLWYRLKYIIILIRSLVGFSARKRDIYEMNSTCVHEWINIKVDEAIKTNKRVDGQATKGAWWMPWHQESMKDVISCDKLRVGAHSQRSGDFRMGKPAWETSCIVKWIHSFTRIDLGNWNI